ncbi:MAG: hypothetical protein EOP20_14505 [Hyphomicrobiales bacterium]|jgi:hypothetical protein|nr:MAG: hypothetical protein EOP20_14505 [Hyphomicrobiales bacterium]
MDTPISEAEAFGLLQTRRDAFTTAATPFLVGVDIDTPTGAAAADSLLNMTIAAYEGQLAPEASARGFPRAVYSLFGDNLVPLLKDVLGTSLPVAFLARCVDSYWRSATRAMAPQ